MAARRKPGDPVYDITNVMILDRANMHHTPTEKSIYTFNKRDLLAFSRELIACAAGMPYPGPTASVFASPYYRTPRNKPNLHQAHARDSTLSN